MITYTEGIIAIGVLYSIIVLSLLFSFFFVDDPLGYSFCERMGHDGVRIFSGDTYSKYYGKITCHSSFSGEHISETFNVERKWGRFYATDK